MEIVDPRNIQISNSLRKTLNFIDRGIAELNSKNLSTKQRQKILDALMVPHIRSSLGIEDIRASARQTKEVLDFYRIHDEVKEGKGNQDIVNLQDANEFICSDDNLRRELSSSFIKQVHYLVSKDSKVRGPGEFKDRPNEFKNGVATPEPLLVQELIDTLSVYFECSDEQNPIVLACWLHHQISKIHPFNDGNGRTARTLQDWVLYKNKYLPCSTGSLNRLTYYDILEDADSGEWEGLVEHIAQAQSDSLAIAMQSIKASENARARRMSLLNFFSERKEKFDDEEYNAWRYQANTIIHAFENECENYNEELNKQGLWCKFLKNDVIPKSKWNLIKEDGYDNRNNAFVIYFYNDSKAFYKCIGYFARHYLRDSDTAVANNSRTIKDCVSLYLGGHDEPAEVDFPAKGHKLKHASSREVFAELPWEDERISLREVLIYENTFYKYRYITRWLQREYLDKGIKIDPNSDHEIWIAEKGDPQDIASEYIYDMFSYKTGLKEI